MKKLAIVAAVCVATLLAGAYYYFAGKEYVIRVPESTIQSKLGEKLPLTKTYLFIIQITLSNPRVELENGSDRVAAGLDVEFNITINNNPKSLGGKVDISGGVIYVSDKGQFFLTDPVIEDLSVQGIAPEYTGKANEALTRALSEYYKTHPIYTLRVTDAKQAAARMVLKDVIIENKELVVTLGI